VHDESVDVFITDFKQLTAVICCNGRNWEAFVAQAFINGMPEEAMRSVEAEALGKAWERQGYARIAKPFLQETNCGPHYCSGGEPGCGDVQLTFIPVNVCERTMSAMIDTGFSTSVVAIALVSSAKLVRVDEAVRRMDGSVAVVQFRATRSI